MRLYLRRVEEVKKNGIPESEIPFFLAFNFVFCDVVIRAPRPDQRFRAESPIVRFDLTRFDNLPARVIRPRAESPIVWFDLTRRDNLPGVKTQFMT